VSNYVLLANHLETVGTETWPTTFGEIEKIVGRKLPPSAYRHRPWWSNNTANSAMTRIWIRAGWKTEQVDMAAQKLVFRRARNFDKTSLVTSKPTLTITLRNPETYQYLRTRAMQTVQSVEQVACDIIERNAKPSLAEKLATAASILKAGPKLHDQDVVQMIRDDRNER
jgi:hypothetical protein